MTQYCNLNTKIYKVFDYNRLDEIADILINEMDTIIETITPSKLIHGSNIYNKWHNTIVDRKAKIKYKAHNKAKKLMTLTIGEILGGKEINIITI